MKKRLFLPGPVEVRQKILNAMAKPPIGHRTDEFRKLFHNVQKGLQKIFETQNEIFIIPSSATGAMEAAIRNCVNKKVLCLTNGAFGERWAEIARLCQKEVEIVEADWGKAIRAEMVEKKLLNEDFEAVCLVHVETSTGVINPLQEIAEVVRKSGALLLVDAVASLGAIKVDIDKLNIDVCFTGSQKGLALPPGVAIISVSKRAIKKSRSVANKGFYFNFELLLERSERSEPLTTPSTSHIFALDMQLKEIEKEGLLERERRHYQLAKLCRNLGESLGFKVFSEKGFEAPTLTCFENSLNLDTKKFLKFLKERGFTISDGYGKLKGKTLRIGHMGDYKPKDLELLFDAFNDFLKAHKIPKSEKRR